jgi:hypothetical protein
MPPRRGAGEKGGEEAAERVSDIGNLEAGRREEGAGVPDVSYTTGFLAAAG